MIGTGKRTSKESSHRNVMISSFTLTLIKILKSPVELCVGIGTEERGNRANLRLTCKGFECRAVSNARPATFKPMDINEATLIDVSLCEVKELLGTCPCSKHSQGEEFAESGESIDYLSAELNQRVAAGTSGPGSIRVWQSLATVR